MRGLPWYDLTPAGEVVPVRDIEEWAQSLKLQWPAAKFQLRERVCGADVSTVFLGIDHNFYDTGPPIVFETMVFGGPMDGEQRRYSTIDDARFGHWLVKQYVREASSWHAIFYRHVFRAAYWRIVWLWRNGKRLWKRM